MAQKQQIVTLLRVGEREEAPPNSLMLETFARKGELGRTAAVLA